MSTPPSVAAAQRTHAFIHTILCRPRHQSVHPGTERRRPAAEGHPGKVSVAGKCDRLQGDALQRDACMEYSSRDTAAEGYNGEVSAVQIQQMCTDENNPPHPGFPLVASCWRQSSTMSTRTTPRSTQTTWAGERERHGAQPPVCTPFTSCLAQGLGSKRSTPRSAQTALGNDKPRSPHIEGLGLVCDEQLQNSSALAGSCPWVVVHDNVRCTQGQLPAWCSSCCTMH